MDFFRIVTVEKGRHHGFGVDLLTEAYESTLQEVALEVVLTVGLCLIGALLLRYGPVSWELGLGALMNREHRRVAPSSTAKRSSTAVLRDSAAADVRTAHQAVATRSTTSEAAATQEASGVPQVRAAVESKPITLGSDEGAQRSAVAAQTLVAEERHDDPKHSELHTHGSHHHSHPHPHHHCDLDAVLDEFCEEEELMDEAFIATISDQHAASAPGSMGKRLPVEGTAAKVEGEARTREPSAVAPGAELPAQGGVGKGAARSADSSIEKELAKRMMRAIDRPPTTGRSAGAADSSVKASSAVATPNVSDSAPARTGQPPQPLARDNKATLPAPRKVTPAAAVDLDAAFDELQSCEDALSEALVDSVVEESHIPQKAKH